MSNLKSVVGLFGTAGSSKWREERVIPILEAAGIAFFNPVVKDWNEEAMRNEAEHAATDQVILIVVTGETTAVASMAESGWIALEAIARDQKVVLVLEDMPAESCPAKDELGGAFTPNKTRKLLRSHLVKAAEAYPEHIFLVDSVEAAGRKAVELMRMAWTA